MNTISYILDDTEGNKILNLLREAGTCALDIRLRGGSPHIISADDPNEAAIGFTVFDADGRRESAHHFTLYLRDAKRSISTLEATDVDANTLKQLIKVPSGRQQIASIVEQAIKETPEGEELELIPHLEEITVSDFKGDLNWEV
jgi:hypothetical protein